MMIRVMFRKLLTFSLVIVCTSFSGLNGSSWLNQKKQSMMQVAQQYKKVVNKALQRETNASQSPTFTDHVVNAARQTQVSKQALYWTKNTDGTWGLKDTWNLLEYGSLVRFAGSGDKSCKLNHKNWNEDFYDSIKVKWVDFFNGEVVTCDSVQDDAKKSYWFMRGEAPSNPSERWNVRLGSPLVGPDAKFRPECFDEGSNSFYPKSDSGKHGINGWSYNKLVPGDGTNTWLLRAADSKTLMNGKFYSASATNVQFIGIDGITNVHYQGDGYLGSDGDAATWVIDKNIPFSYLLQQMNLGKEFSNAVSKTLLRDILGNVGDFGLKPSTFEKFKTTFNYPAQYKPTIQVSLTAGLTLEYGGQIKLRHRESNTRLTADSRPYTGPYSSKGPQVYGQLDDSRQESDSWFVIQSATMPAGTPVNDGDAIRLVHMASGFTLCSGTAIPPVSYNYDLSPTDPAQLDREVSVIPDTQASTCRDWTIHFVPGNPGLITLTNTGDGGGQLCAVAGVLYPSDDIFNPVYLNVDKTSRLAANEWRQEVTSFNGRTDLEVTQDRADYAEWIVEDYIGAPSPESVVLNAGYTKVTGATFKKIAIDSKRMLYGINGDGSVSSLDLSNSSATAQPVAALQGIRAREIAIGTDDSKWIIKSDGTVFCFDGGPVTVGIDKAVAIQVSSKSDVSIIKAPDQNNLSPEGMPQVWTDATWSSAGGSISKSSSNAQAPAGTTGDLVKILPNGPKFGVCVGYDRTLYTRDMTSLDYSSASLRVLDATVSADGLAVILGGTADASGAFSVYTSDLLVAKVAGLADGAVVQIAGGLTSYPNASLYSGTAKKQDNITNEPLPLMDPAATQQAFFTIKRNGSAIAIVDNLAADKGNYLAVKNFTEINGSTSPVKLRAGFQSLPDSGLAGDVLGKYQFVPVYKSTATVDGVTTYQFTLQSKYDRNPLNQPGASTAGKTATDLRPQYGYLTAQQSTVVPDTTNWYLSDLYLSGVRIGKPVSKDHATTFTITVGAAATQALVTTQTITGPVLTYLQTTRQTVIDNVTDSASAQNALKLVYGAIVAYKSRAANWLEMTRYKQQIDQSPDSSGRVLTIAQTAADYFIINFLKDPAIKGILGLKADPVLPESKPTMTSSSLVQDYANAIYYELTTPPRLLTAQGGTLGIITGVVNGSVVAIQFDQQLLFDEVLTDAKYTLLTSDEQAKAMDIDNVWYKNGSIATSLPEGSTQQILPLFLGVDANNTLVAVPEYVLNDNCQFTLEEVLERDYTKPSATPPNGFNDLRYHIKHNKTGKYLKIPTASSTRANAVGADRVVLVDGAPGAGQQEGEFIIKQTPAVLDPKGNVTTPESYLIRNALTSKALYLNKGADAIYAQFTDDVGSSLTPTHITDIAKDGVTLVSDTVYTKLTTATKLPDIAARVTAYQPIIAGLTPTEAINVALALTQMQTRRYRQTQDAWNAYAKAGKDGMTTLANTLITTYDTPANQTTYPTIHTVFADLLDKVTNKPTALENVSLGATLDILHKLANGAVIPPAIGGVIKPLYTSATASGRANIETFVSTVEKAVTTCVNQAAMGNTKVSITINDAGATITPIFVDAAETLSAYIKKFSDAVSANLDDATTTRLITAKTTLASTSYTTDPVNVLVTMAAQQSFGAGESASLSDQVQKLVINPRIAVTDEPLSANPAPDDPTAIIVPVTDISSCGLPHWLTLAQMKKMMTALATASGNGAIISDASKYKNALLAVQSLVALPDHSAFTQFVDQRMADFNVVKADPNFNNKIESTNPADKVKVKQWALQSIRVYQGWNDWNPGSTTAQDLRAKNKFVRLLLSFQRLMLKLKRKNIFTNSADDTKALADLDSLVKQVAPTTTTT